MGTRSVGVRGVPPDLADPENTAIRQGIQRRALVYVRSFSLDPRQRSGLPELPIRGRNVTGTTTPDGIGAGRWRIPAGLFGLALTVRAVAAWQTAAIFNDGPLYLRVASLFRQGAFHEALAHHYHPLYPMATALSSTLTGDLETAGVWVSVLSGSAAVVAGYFFWCRSFGRGPAWIAGVLLALHPYAVIFSSDVQSEGLYFALFLSAVAALWRGIEEASIGRSAVAGALAGLAYLVRPEGIGLVAVGAGFAALLLFRGRLRVTGFARIAVPLALGAVVVAGPYVVNLHALTGEWRLTQKKSIVDLARPREPAAAPVPDGLDRPRWRPPPMARPAPREAALVPARIDFEPRSLSAGLELARMSLGTLWPALVLLVLVGMRSAGDRPGDRGLFLLVMLGVYGVVLYGLALNVGYLNRRHVLAPLLPLLGYGGLGVPIVGRWLWRALRPRMDTRDPRPAIGLALGLVALLTLPKALEPQRRERLANRRAAEWLASHEELQGPVSAEKYRTAYYAGEAFVSLSRAGAKADLERLRRSGADFLIVDDVQLRQRPALSARRAKLIELYRVEAAGRTAYVFDLRALPDAPPGSAPPAAVGRDPVSPPAGVP